jgi:monofunctional biosynthetic peptidoglycan transglycosylase
VIGAEPAAQPYFAISASRQSAEQAAPPAATAPNPRLFEHHPGAPGLAKKMRIILARMPAADLP